MAFYINKPRFTDPWTIYADSSSDETDAKAAAADAPVGSRLLVAEDSGAPTEYVLFPSDWVQVNNFS